MPVAQPWRRMGFQPAGCLPLALPPFHVQPVTGQTYPPFLSASLLGHEPPSQPSQHPFSSAPREAGVGTAQCPSPSEHPGLPSQLSGQRVPQSLSHASSQPHSEGPERPLGTQGSQRWAARERLV